MKKTFVYLLIQIVSISAHSQKTSPDIQPINKMDSVDLFRIIDLLDVSYNRYSLAGKFKDYYCNLLVFEYREGKCVDSISFRDKLPSSFQGALLIGQHLEKGKFDIGIYSQVVADTSLKLYATMGGAGFRPKLRLDRERSYSWKEVYQLPDAKHPLKPGALFPLLTYTAPVAQKFAAHPNTLEFCNISGEVIPYTDWYEKLGIEHYFIFFIRLEK